jgi:hypothetical protein
MIKFLSLLLDVVNKLFTAWDQHHWKQQGRQETIKEVNDALNHQIKEAETAVNVSDPERDERLRNRFDRSRFDK